MKWYVCFLTMVIPFLISLKTFYMCFMVLGHSLIRCPYNSSHMHLDYIVPLLVRPRTYMYFMALGYSFFGLATNFSDILHDYRSFPFWSGRGLFICFMAQGNFLLGQAEDFSNVLHSFRSFSFGQIKNFSIHPKFVSMWFA